MKKLFYATTMIFSVNYLHSLTLNESIKEVMHNNPIIKERLSNYRSTLQDYNIANSEYYPQIDLVLSGGKQKSNSKTTSFEDKDLDVYENSIVVTRNIFNGFATQNNVAYQNNLVLASAHHYIEKTNSVIYSLISAYIEVLKQDKLVTHSQKSLTSHEKIYKKIKKAFRSGDAILSEVQKIQSSVSLAQSNLIVQKNNLMDATYNLYKILGRRPIVSELKEPNFNIPLPKDSIDAITYALSHNPSIIVSDYNIKSAKSKYLQAKQIYYPKLDLKVKRSWRNNTSGIEGKDTQESAMLTLSYNLYRGGSDSARIQKQVSVIHQEVENKRIVKRDLIQSLELSWSAYTMIDQQINYLKDYQSYSQKTLNLYYSEYDSGKRTLLDLLSSENDLIKSDSELTKAKYDLLLSKYRILNNMGTLVSAITKDDYVASKEVGLKDNLFNTKKDTLSISLDSDNDKITDNIDLCDNSLLNSSVLAHGCYNFRLDTDGDGVDSYKDQCLQTPKGVEVDKDGCAVDLDEDGVKDYEDECLDTPLNQEVDLTGCKALKTTNIKDWLDSHETINTSIKKDTPLKMSYNIKKDETLSQVHSSAEYYTAQLALFKSISNAKRFLSNLPKQMKENGYIKQTEKNYYSVRFSKVNKNNISNLKNILKYHQFNNAFIIKTKD